MQFQSVSSISQNYWEQNKISKNTASYQKFNSPNNVSFGSAGGKGYNPHGWDVVAYFRCQLSSNFRKRVIDSILEDSEKVLKDKSSSDFEREFARKAIKWIKENPGKTLTSFLYDLRSDLTIG